MTPNPSKAVAKYQWQNALLTSGKDGLKATVRNTLMTMAVRADNRDISKTFFITQDEVAEWTGLHVTKVREHIRKAKEAGWLVEVEKGRTGRASVYRLSIGATPNPSGKTPGKRIEPSENARLEPSENARLQPSENARPTSPERGPGTTPVRDSLNTVERHRNSLNASVAGGKPELIPDDWHPNGIHVNACKDINVRATALANVFRAWAHGEGERSSSWDRRFGALIKLIGESQNPEDKGFSGIDDYDDRGVMDADT